MGCGRPLLQDGLRISPLRHFATARAAQDEVSYMPLLPSLRCPGSRDAGIMPYSSACPEPPETRITCPFYYRFLIFSDDDTYHDPTGFGAFLSLFNPEQSFFVAPSVQPNAGSDFNLNCVMNLVTPICQNRGQCIGLQPNCHSLRNGDLEGRKLDLSKPYGGADVSPSTKPVCGDDACEQCMAFVYERTHIMDDRRPSGCANNDLKYAGYQQPLIISAAAVKRLLPTFLGAKGLRAQCQVLGVTHDNALGVFLWRHQIPTVSHFNACSRLWYPPGKESKNDLFHALYRNPKQFEEVHALYADRYNVTATSNATNPQAWRSLRHKIHQCFEQKKELRLPAFNESGEEIHGGVQLTRYWKRTSEEDRIGGEPFVFEDCANYPEDFNTMNVSKTWFARPPRPLLSHHFSRTSMKHLP